MMHPTVGTLPSRPILVVDDDRALCTAVRMILELEGHQVLTTVDGVTALTLVRDARPAVVLLDLHLPGMDGWQVFGHIRALAPELPVVFMTAKAHVYREATVHHAAGALPKPFDVDLVLDTVARFIPTPAP